MHDYLTNMTAFQNPSRNSMCAVPPALLRKTFQPVTNERDLGFDHAMLDNFVDDDDFSDHDSHYSEDLDDDFRQELIDPGPNMTQQLLDFADIVNNDIKKFFGPKKGVDDSCDVYADKWKTIKSGRERYYRDLLRIAEGDNDLSKSSKDDMFESTKADVDNRHTFSGKFDKRLGLGPLKELFERGLRNYKSGKSDNKLKSRENRTEQSKYGTLPMQQRCFPESFWKQPLNISKKYHAVNNINHLTNSPKPPDFSDLLETWTMMGESGFSGDMSSDANTTSS